MHSLGSTCCSPIAVGIASKVVLASKHASSERWCGLRMGSSHLSTCPNPSTDEHLVVHNDGLHNSEVCQIAKEAATSSSMPNHGSQSPKQPTLPAQSYLRYQGESFIQRFNANRFILITLQFEAHVIAQRASPASCLPVTGLST
ncbi:hypothetical protein BKA70DRAFT_376229 [Coprinopsis sp. MPI-PUGE-AT-0042]|nr:hypothetical protein BKA70DRAFT_376229 [Coprinopsis sp. MPI-PUGE-AT-0042]